MSEGLDVKIKKRSEQSSQEGKSESVVNDADFKKAAMQTGAQMMTQSAGEGSGLGTVGGGLMSYGAATANPYLLAGGLGLSVLGAGEANRRKEEEAQRQAYNDRIRQRQEAMARIASMGIQ